MECSLSVSTPLNSILTQGVEYLPARNSTEVGIAQHEGRNFLN